jgi:hypothetical protein
MYPREKHRLPHIHIEAPGIRASIALGTGAVLVGKASNAMIEEARVYISENREALIAVWKELNQ